MKVLQVVPCIFAESAGPSYSVPALCRGLQNAGCDVSLHFVGERPVREFSYPVCVYKAHRFPHSNLGRSPEMLAALKKECRSAQIIHNNSLWMFPNVYPAWAKRGTECKLVTAPRGTLAKWALKHHWVQKKLFGWYAQNQAVRATDMWHATCEKEYEEIRAAGFRQPVALVPIGIDLPDIKQDGRKRRTEGRRKLVFFGRLHKVKAVDNLIMAWGRVADRFDDWELVIVGPDGGVRGELEALVVDRDIPRVSFVGELKGNAKYEFLAASDLCVLPSHTENFGVTVAEALVCETPVIASQGTPWSGLDKNGAGWWIPIGVKALAEKLKQALATSDEDLHQMGMRGREWMRRDFDWNSIGAKMKSAYEWLCHGGDKPEFVYS